MQLIAALLTEAVNIVLMCTQENIPNTILNFFALSVVCEIDDYYAKSLQNFKLKKIYEDPLEVIETHKMWKCGKVVDGTGVKVR